MHQARTKFTFVCASNGITTVPSSRPPGRKILYATRTSVLILSADCTVTIRSEYNFTASVFSSWAGDGTPASACIQAGASVLAAHAPAAPTESAHTSNTNEAI